MYRLPVTAKPHTCNVKIYVCAISYGGVTLQPLLVLFPPLPLIQRAQVQSWFGTSWDTLVWSSNCRYTHLCVTKCDVCGHGVFVQYLCCDLCCLLWWCLSIPFATNRSPEPSVCQPGGYNALLHWRTPPIISIRYASAICVFLCNSQYHRNIKLGIHSLMHCSHWLGWVWASPTLMCR